MLTVMDQSNTELPPLESTAEKFDWSARLSIDTVRRHCKLDDIPRVTDDRNGLGWPSLRATPPERNRK